MQSYFHWSPSTRRKSINRRGFLTHQKSTDGLWRPPYTCFATSPRLAWELSGVFRAQPGETWDLWEADLREQTGFEELFFDHPLHRPEEPYSGPMEVKEVRVYERVFKRNVWLVGERTVV